MQCFLKTWEEIGISFAELEAVGWRCLFCPPYRHVYSNVLGDRMAGNKEEFISLGSGFFSEESYQDFVKQKSPLHNKRLRGKNETIFDALSSKEADFTKGIHGDIIIKTIQNYKGAKKR